MEPDRQTVEDLRAHARAIRVMSEKLRAYARALRAFLGVPVPMAGEPFAIDLAYEQGREHDRHAPELETAISRIIREALNNATRHGHAGRAGVEIKRTKAPPSVFPSETTGSVLHNSQDQRVRPAWHARAGGAPGRNARNCIANGKGHNHQRQVSRRNLAGGRRSLSAPPSQP
jgi:hypothetical protein